MVKKCLIEVVFLTAALAGCNLQTETDLSSDKEIHERSVNSGIPSFPDFRAAWEHSDDTRTMLDEDGVHVLWEPQDELLVLYGSIGYNIRQARLFYVPH